MKLHSPGVSESRRKKSIGFYHFSFSYLQEEEDDTLIADKEVTTCSLLFEKLWNSLMILLLIFCILWVIHAKSG